MCVFCLKTWETPDQYKMTRTIELKGHASPLLTFFKFHFKEVGLLWKT